MKVFRMNKLTTGLKEKKLNLGAIKRELKEHSEKLKYIKDRKEPKPAELATISLEEEFED